MTSFDVVLVPFPFADLSATKRRPCLVLVSFKPSSLHEHLVLAMMTSQTGSSFPHDVAVNHLTVAGLPKPTLIRLSKVVTLDAGIVVKTLGRLHIQDRQVVKNEFTKLFKPVL